MAADLNIPDSVLCIIQPSREHTTLFSTKIPIQLPKEGTDEHLIRVKCVSPCAGELTWAITDSHLMHPDRCDVPCFDMAGIVVSAPPSSPFQRGSEVYVYTEAFRSGNAREYSIARTSQLAQKPRNLSWEDATSVPLSALTAYQGLFEYGRLDLGWENEEARAANVKKSILITAAAGGVGVWAVQLAKLAGVGEIIAVNGTANTKFVYTLGATEVVDYTKQSLGTWAAAKNAKVDMVLDMVGAQTLKDAWSMVKEGGRLISIVERDPSALRPVDAANGIESRFFILKPNGKQLEKVTGFLEAGKVKPVVDSVWEFGQYKDAFARLEGGHARGKVIIRVQ